MEERMMDTIVEIYNHMDDSDKDAFTLEDAEDMVEDQIRMDKEAYARWKEAEEFITQHGTIVKTPSGYWQQVPQVSIAQTYLKIMNKFAEQFGLTPSSRSRIIASDGGPADAADEMENLLGGGGS